MYFWYRFVLRIGTISLAATLVFLYKSRLMPEWSFPSPFLTPFITPRVRQIYSSPWYIILLNVCWKYYSPTALLSVNVVFYNQEIPGSFPALPWNFPLIENHSKVCSLRKGVCVLCPFSVLGFLRRRLLHYADHRS